MSTNLLRHGRVGSHHPRIQTRPPYASEAAGREAIDLAASVGLVLDPWQQHVVNVALAEREDGRYAAREVAFLVARQNGKGGVLEAIALHGMFLVGDPLTLWTAHQTKTAFEAFLRVRSWIDGSDDLRRLVSRVNAAHGDEGITLKSGARLRFLARSKSSGRGFSPQRIIFDEAQELSKLAIEAMLPSMRAQANRQAIYTGTVPGPEINNPEHWTRLRDRGRAGNAGRLAWLEWTPNGSESPEGAAELDLHSRKAWRASNPSLGVDRPTALALDALEGDYESLDADSFARECLSIWPTITGAGPEVFGPGKWLACASDVPPGKPAAVGIAVSMDRAWASIGAASSDAVPHLGSLENGRRRGTEWVAAEAKRLQDEHGVAVVIDKGGPASSLVSELEELGVTVTLASLDEYVGACASLYDAVQIGGVTHGSYTDLDAAVDRATTRTVGERWAWGRKSGEVSMLEAVTLAHWGAVNATADPSVYAF